MSKLKKLFKHLTFKIRCFFVAINLMKGGDYMKFALHLAFAIMQGLLKWDDITEPWKPAVKYWLDAYGVGTDGKPVVDFSL